jgi:PAS domain S-box-containing protein
MANERIFIVEDERIVAADLESMLKELGYEVAGMAASGESAVEKVEEAMPDLVLMDIRLEGTMDGIDAAEQISARFNIPVTFLTAYADESTLGRAKTTMPYGYILKPFEERELRTAIELALYKHKMESMMATIEGWHATALHSMPDAVIATDKQGNITFINARAESLLGWKLEELYGKKAESILSLSPESSPMGFSARIIKALKDPTASRSEDPIIASSKEGRKIHARHRMAAIKGEDGSLTGVVIVLHDAETPLEGARALFPNKIKTS